jgi:hypothetical protein
VSDEQVPPPHAWYPLDTQRDIGSSAALDQELLLRDVGTPWAILLAAYVDKLSELAIQETCHIAGRGLDEGHAGGCG